MTKQLQEYIKHHTWAIAGGLTKKHPDMRGHLALGEDAIGNMSQILAIIEWATQHWKLGKPNLVLIVPSWLRTMEALPTTTPVRGEPGPSVGITMTAIHVHSPATWAWLCVLLQFFAKSLDRPLVWWSDSKIECIIWNYAQGSQPLDAQSWQIELEYGGEGCSNVVRHYRPVYPAAPQRVVGAEGMCPWCSHLGACDWDRLHRPPWGQRGWVRCGRESWSGGSEISRGLPMGMSLATRAGHAQKG